jgi:hypothetical protein
MRAFARREAIHLLLQKLRKDGLLRRLRRLAMTTLDRSVFSRVGIIPLASAWNRSALLQLRPFITAKARHKHQSLFLGSVEGCFFVPASNFKGSAGVFRQAWPQATAERREAGFTENAGAATLGQVGQPKPPAIAITRPRFKILCVSSLNPPKKKNCLFAKLFFLSSSSNKIRR